MGRIPQVAHIAMEIRIALPNKGRLYQPTLDLLSKAGIILLEKDLNALFANTADPDVRVIFVRASDIPKFVESDAADLGITGYDYMVEGSADIIELVNLEYGRAHIVMAAHEKTGISSVNDIKRGTRIATKLSRITTDFLQKKRLEATLVKISGAAEIMPYIGVSDLIVDTMSTGTTLRTHGLKVITEILETSCRLIANRVSLKEKESKIRELVTAFESVVRAAKKKLVMMNVPEDRLQNVIKTIPSMGGPTLARVESEVPTWEVYSVVDDRDVYKIIGMAKKAGARDILVLPIERIVP